MATAYQQRPSDLFGIDPAEGWLRFDFDEAVMLFGRWVENERDKVKLSEAERKSRNSDATLARRRTAKVRELLDGGGGKTHVRTVADAAAMGATVVRKKEG